MRQRIVSILSIILLGVTIVSAGVLAYFWQPDRSVAELAHWQLPDSEFVEVQGMQVHIVQSDLCRQRLSKVAQKDNIHLSSKASEVIVLLHGTSASLHTWNDWATQLEVDHCVIRMDLPGFGLTGPFVDESTAYTAQNYAIFVKQVLDRLSVERASLVGNSLGGKVAWLTTALYPELVDQLILIDAVGYPATPKHVPIGFKLARYPVLDPVIKYVLPRSVVKNSLLSVYTDDSKVTDSLIERYFELTLREGNRGALSQRLREFDNQGQQALIQTISVPTLILWGAKDNLIPVENAEHFHQDIKGSQLVVFDNLGHVPQEEAPKATVAIAKRFLAGELVNEQRMPNNE